MQSDRQIARSQESTHCNQRPWCDNTRPLHLAATDRLWLCIIQLPQRGAVQLVSPVTKRRILTAKAEIKALQRRQINKLMRWRERRAIKLPATHRFGSPY